MNLIILSVEKRWQQNVLSNNWIVYFLTKKKKLFLADWQSIGKRKFSEGEKISGARLSFVACASFLMKSQHEFSSHVDRAHVLPHFHELNVVDFDEVFFETTQEKETKS